MNALPSLAVPAAQAPAKPSLAGATRAELAPPCARSVCPSATSRCARRRSGTGSIIAAPAIFQKCSTSPSQMRAMLAESFTLARPHTTEQVSADGTRKWLIRMDATGPLNKGAEIECVYIPESDRGTLCVSSQVGCTLDRYPGGPCRRKWTHRPRRCPKHTRSDQAHSAGVHDIPVKVVPGGFGAEEVRRHLIKSSHTLLASRSAAGT